ncbi:hypothetical protein BG844_23385 [Couchioplanes caeruleus subsp. caeruleus]|uniref:Bacterial repeat domain-containing protein n=2 Tax=Couchioplanes caeruleus TaxID=56438 RepID=A0A1K0FGK7_9ACTN|nr:hypothetical protein BG844_23385 [Couchioplanes caeruleus subsp. caeruleus]
MWAAGFGALTVLAAFSPAPAAGVPVQEAAIVPQTGSYAFGCGTSGKDCAGTFRVSGNAVRNVMFRPVRCTEGQISLNTVAAVSGGRFTFSGTPTSSVSVPTPVQATGTFQTTTKGTIRLTYSAPEVGCAAATTTFSFTRRNGAKLGWQGWRDAGVAIDGAVDADVVVLPDGRMRLYYGLGVGGSDSWRITSSISTDGKTWTPEETNLVGRDWGPADVLRLPDGRFRMYYTPSNDPTLAPDQQRSVRSAISDDGINWTVEPGHRLNPAAFTQLAPTDGTEFQVSHPGVMQLADGTWLMLAAYNIEKGFNPNGASSSEQTELVVWATSADGLDFTARGIAVDSRNKATFDGFASSPDPVLWEDGSVRAYFWSPGPSLPHNQKMYNGIQYTTFTGTGWTAAKPVRTSTAFPGAASAAYPGGDPTVAIFKGRIFMYYGHFQEGHQTTEYSVMTSRAYSVRVRRTGSGTIASGLAFGSGAMRNDMSTGLRCTGNACATTVLAGTKLWLFATPGKGYRFAGWTGCNSSLPYEYPPPRPDYKTRLCWISATKSVTVTAKFVKR